LVLFFKKSKKKKNLVKKKVGSPAQLNSAARDVGWVFVV
jgi:hypothetical protein